jgi:hypothetical protein
VDVGGKFTDLVVLNEQTGTLSFTKAPTTPRQPAQGVLAAIHKSDLELPHATTFFHGTTLGINTMLEREKTKVSKVRGIAVGHDAPEPNEVIMFPGTDRELRLGKRSDMTVTPGDVVICRPAGRGGYGDPLLREPAAVAWDVRNEYVSRAVGETVYGVILGDDDGVDAAATARTRERLAADLAP